MSKGKPGIKTKKKGTDAKLIKLETEAPHFCVHCLS